MQKNDATLVQYQNEFKQATSATSPSQDRDANAPLKRVEMTRQIQNDLDGQTTLLVESGDAWFDGEYMHLPGGARFEIEMLWGSIDGLLPSALVYHVGGFMVAGPAEPYPDAIGLLGRETAHAVMTATYESRALLRQVLQEEEIACEYREPGAVRLALTEAQAEKLKQEATTVLSETLPPELWPFRLDRPTLTRWSNLGG